MARYKVELVVEETNIKVVEKLLRKHFGKDSVSATCKKIEVAKSRADRLAEAQADVESAKDTATELKDELQNWYDNLHENFQNGDKGNEIQEAIDALESLESDLEILTFDVNFPSMY